MDTACTPQHHAKVASAREQRCPGTRDEVGRRSAAIRAADPCAGRSGPGSLAGDQAGTDPAPRTIAIVSKTFGPGDATLALQTASAVRIPANGKAIPLVNGHRNPGMLDRGLAPRRSFHRLEIAD
jgi:hypothetical protein